MATHPVVTRADWLEARRALLAREKAFSRLRDELNAERRALPWVKVETPYVFDGPAGPVTLDDLFGRSSQLVVYHFMFGPTWDEGCPSCSFWADNFDGVDVHLRHRDIALAAVSRAPIAKIEAYRSRMGWRFAWVSSLGNTFNRDHHVAFTPDEVANRNGYYNFAWKGFPGEEAPGISVFARDGEGIYHTYSCYSRGLDMLNGAYHLIDLTPKGRDEAGLTRPMAWVRRRDQYED